MKLKPHKYQVRTLEHLIENRKAAVFLDMGMGKTVITLSAIAELQDRGEVGRVMLFAPLRVCRTVWKQEAAKWDHTKHLNVQLIRGSSDAERLAILNDPDVDIFLLNYDWMLWLTEYMLDVKSKLPFDLIVFDESSKMKSHESKRFKFLKPHTFKMYRAWILTGTPAPQSYFDLWSQFFILDQGKRLGPYVTKFRDRYFKQVDRDGRKWELKGKPASDEIERLISDITLCMNAEDYLKLPKIIRNTVHVELPDKLMDKYLEFEAELFMQLDEGEVEAFNLAALTTKCRQFTSGQVYDAERKVLKVHDLKYQALKDIIEDAQGSPMLVIIEFRHEAGVLKKLFPKAPQIIGGTKDSDSDRYIDDWNAGKLPVLVVHAASVGHGLNLQYGGHQMVFTSTTWSLELYQQMVKRLHRQGQSKPVIVNHLVVPNTIDEVVMMSLATKDKRQAGLMSALIEYRRSK